MRVATRPAALTLLQKQVLTPLHLAAQTYATKYRLLLIPLEEREKRPAFKTGPNHQTLATHNPATIDGWWTHRDYNIGLPCTPNRFAVIDVDGAEGETHLAELEAEHGPLPVTWMQTSNRADRPSTQYVYRWPNSQIVPTTRISPQLEVRAHGAQIVAAPSLHPSGTTYTWLIPPSDLPEGPAELPDWVLTLITKPTPPATRPADNRPPTLNQNTSLAEKRLNGLVEHVATAPEGERNQRLNHAAYTAARIPGLTDHEITRRLTTAAETVGLDERETKATIQSGITAGHQDGPDPEHAEPTPTLLTKPVTAETENPTNTDWQPVNLNPILDGNTEHLDPPPSVLKRSDGICLLYAGELNWVSGEPETGKSWLAQLATVQEITSGNNALYVDLEDTPSRIVSRLRNLGLTNKQISTQFHYIRPAVGAGPNEVHALLELASTCTLAVIDGTTDLHLIHGLSPEDNKDAATLVSQLLRPLANAGPAVLPLDHVTKNRETRGRYAIGAQHKLAAVRGASYHLETVDPMGRGTVGHATLYITKDRPGHIRGIHTRRQGTQKHRAGDLYVDSTTNTLELRIAPPEEATEYAEAKDFQEIIETIEERCVALRRAVSKSEIYKLIGGNKARFEERFEALLNSNQIVKTSQSRGGHATFAPSGRFDEPPS